MAILGAQAGGRLLMASLVDRLYKGAHAAAHRAEISAAGGAKGFFRGCAGLVCDFEGATQGAETVGLRGSPRSITDLHGSPRSPAESRASP